MKSALLSVFVVSLCLLGPCFAPRLTHAVMPGSGGQEEVFSSAEKMGSGEPFTAKRPAPGAAVDQSTDGPQAPVKIAPFPPRTKGKHVSLRKTALALGPEDVKSMLTRYNFYVTCWNDNGDFCNPEGDFENDFRKNHEGTVTDRATGLMWQQSGSSGPMTWHEAEAYVVKVNREALAGYADWRLPSVEELTSLMENFWKNSDLFIDPAFDKAQRFVWSADTKDMNTAWKANFHKGFIIPFPKTNKSSVRLVRSLP